jgi:uncharacterized protein YcfL
MQATYRWLAGTLCTAMLLLAGCAASARAPEAAPKEEPSRLVPIEGTELNRVILTEQAAHRIDVQTAAVSRHEVEGKEELVIPYAAVIYDTEGEAWAYTNPEPLTFVRHQLDIEAIEGDEAVLSVGPEEGTLVVIVGATELYGAEFEFQEG